MQSKTQVCEALFQEAHIANPVVEDICVANTGRNREDRCDPQTESFLTQESAPRLAAARTQSGHLAARPPEQREGPSPGRHHGFQCRPERGLNEASSHSGCVRLPTF